MYEPTLPDRITEPDSIGTIGSSSTPTVRRLQFCRIVIPKKVYEKMNLIEKKVMDRVLQILMDSTITVELYPPTGMFEAHTATQCSVPSKEGADE